ncbi:MAG: hypothetical protein JW712_05510 [Dehalococcoidales bacterium]|nr:hypothetical protein [Dehalococcoidales bacterium]
MKIPKWLLNSILVVVAVAACATVVIIWLNNADPLLGKWQDKETGVFINFISSDRLVWSDPRQDGSLKTVQGIYSFDEDDNLIIEWPGTPGLFTSTIGGNTFTYDVTGDNLTLKCTRHTYRLNRIK